MSNENKPKLIVILGQTATGKSDFAVDIAKIVNGEIISADSRQVYKGMNLGTGKITKKEMKKIPHHLLDIVSPKKIFTVNDYKKLADKKIEEIIKRKNIPIICGGTGFYIDAVVNDIYFPDVLPNKKLRDSLSNKTCEQLIKILLKLDPIRAENIDKNNPVRIIRAIEIAKDIGFVPVNCLQPEEEDKKYNTIKIGFSIPDEVLKERINTRLLSRIKKGMLKEIENLHDSSLPNGGISWKRMYNLGLEYRYGSLFIQGKISKDEMLEQLNKEIWHYAKRQKIWFKRDKSIIWINPIELHEKAIAMKKIIDFLK